MSRTNQMVAMQTSSARLRGQSLSLGKMGKRLPLSFRRLRDCDSLLASGLETARVG